MSAREELFRRVAGAFVSEDRANKLIDDVITEALAPKLQQVADWLMSQGHTIAARALDEYIDSRVADEASELDTLQIQVAELRAERHSTNEALDDAVRENAKLRARAAELEAELLKVTGHRDYWHNELMCADARIAELDAKVSSLRQPEDPHDSPLHHDYALGRDLPAFPHQQDRRAL
ncbi:hypothetical protein ABZ621_36745 [Streptomyces sp. NPDC007863]|uniref:hypothetical protein n=1 Tax=Streptomyces sp. NPDC007863 TaxID=3154894 RepID=UPI003402EE17